MNTVTLLTFLIFQALGPATSFAQGNYSSTGSRVDWYSAGATTKWMQDTCNDYFDNFSFTDQLGKSIPLLNQQFKNKVIALKPCDDEQVVRVVSKESNNDYRFQSTIIKFGQTNFKYCTKDLWIRRDHVSNIFNFCSKQTILSQLHDDFERSKGGGQRCELKLIKLGYSVQGSFDKCLIESNVSKITGQFFDGCIDKESNEKGKTITAAVNYCLSDNHMIASSPAYQRCLIVLKSKGVSDLQAKTACSNPAISVDLEKHDFKQCLNKIYVPEITDDYIEALKECAHFDMRTFMVEESREYDRYKVCVQYFNDKDIVFSNGDISNIRVCMKNPKWRELMSQEKFHGCVDIFLNMGLSIGPALNSCYQDEVRENVDSQEFRVCSKTMNDAGINYKSTLICIDKDVLEVFEDKDRNGTKFLTCLQKGMSSTYGDYYQLSESVASENKSSEFGGNSSKKDRADFDNQHPYYWLITDCVDAIQNGFKTQLDRSGYNYSRNFSLKYLQDISIHGRQVHQSPNGEEVIIGGLSALAYNEKNQQLFAISDYSSRLIFPTHYYQEEFLGKVKGKYENPRIFSYDFKYDATEKQYKLKPGKILYLTDERGTRSHYHSGPMDAEGLVLTTNGDWIMSSEVQGYFDRYISRFDQNGIFKHFIPVHPVYNEFIDIHEWEQTRYCWKPLVRKDRDKSKKDQELGPATEEAENEFVPVPVNSGKNHTNPMDWDEFDTNGHPPGTHRRGGTSGSYSSGYKPGHDWQVYKKDGRTFMYTDPKAEYDEDQYEIDEDHPGVCQTYEPVDCDHIDHRVVKVKERGQSENRQTAMLHNEGLESLSYYQHPDGTEYLFTMPETTLVSDEYDGSWKSGSKSERIRIQRFRFDEMQNLFVPDQQFIYLLKDETSNRVSEILAIDENNLLVLEISYNPNRSGKDGKIKSRIFHAKLDTGSDVTSVTSLEDYDDGDLKSGKDGIKAVMNFLVIDLKDIRELMAPGLKIHDNYEGLTFGPRLPNGNRTVIMTSDNNYRVDESQRTKFIIFEFENLP